MSNTVISFAREKERERQKKLISKITEGRHLSGVYAINIIPGGSAYRVSILATITTDTEKRWVIESFTEQEKHRMCDLLFDGLTLHTRHHPDDLELVEDWENIIRSFKIGNTPAVSLFNYDKA